MSDLEVFLSEYGEILILGVAVAVLGKKLYAIGGFDGRNRLRRFVNGLSVYI